MGVILILILVSLSLAFAFLCCFLWAVRSGQYEDTLTPSLRILPDDAPCVRQGEPASPNPTTKLTLRQQPK